jgi:hypothetical protein
MGLMRQVIYACLIFLALSVLAPKQLELGLKTLRGLSADRVELAKEERARAQVQLDRQQLGWLHQSFGRGTAAPAGPSYYLGQGRDHVHESLPPPLPPPPPPPLPLPELREVSIARLRCST